MKKMKRLSLILCLILALQCVLQPVCAEETTDMLTNAATEATEATAAKAAFGTVCINQGCRTIEGQVALDSSGKTLKTSSAAFVYETTTQTVIYAYNPDLKMSPGTLAKLVLALVVAENCDMDEVVTCVDGIQSLVPGSAQRVTPNNLKSGEQLTVNDLMHCLLLLNANDAAVALAMHAAGTTSACVEMMNKRVKQMGCINTEFGNISGLDTAASVSTARDIAKIMVEASKNETLAELMQATTYTVPATNLVEERKDLYTRNYLMDNHIIAQFYDTRVKGGMASYTEGSGASVVCTATNITENNPNGLNLVCVSLGGVRTYDENSGNPTWYGNFEEILDIIKYTFNNYKRNRIIYEGMSVEQWPVIDGESDAVGKAVVNVDSVVPAGVSMDNLVYYYDVKDGSLTAPIQKDELVATMAVWYRNSCLTEVELYSMGNVKSISNSGVNINSTAIKTDSDSAGVMSIVGTVCVIILGIVGVYLVYNNYMRSRIRAQRRKRRAARRRSR